MSQRLRSRRSTLRPIGRLSPSFLSFQRLNLGEGLAIVPQRLGSSAFKIGIVAQWLFSS
jgi:hypothetical protein